MAKAKKAKKSGAKAVKAARAMGKKKNVCEFC